MFKCILISILNINHLIIYSRGQGDSKLNLDGRKVHIGEKGNDLLSKVLEALAILRPQ